MAFGAPTWPSKPHSKCKLALLGSIFGALATLRIELSPRRELNSHGSGIFAVQALLDCCFAALQWVSDAFWTQLGGSWESLGALLVALRPVLAALGALLAALGRLLGRSSAPLGGSWTSLGRVLGQLGLQVASKWHASSLQPHSKCNLALLGSIFGALATLRIELSPRLELNSHGSDILAVQALLDCCFAALQLVSDAFWTQL